MLVSSCMCWVSCVPPVAILRAVFCTICSLSVLVSDALGDRPYGRSILEYGSGCGFVCCEYGFLVFAPLCRGEDFMLIVLHALVAARSMDLL